MNQNRMAVLAEFSSETLRYNSPFMAEVTLRNRSGLQKQTLLSRNFDK